MNDIRNIDWQLLFIRTYNWMSFVYSAVATQTVKSVKYLIESFGNNIYCFYKGSSTPVRLNDYNKDVAGSGTIDFYYNRDLNLVSKHLDIQHIPRTLNIESARLNHGDISLYDLTDFFDTTRYAGNQVPSLNQWIGIWQLENGIYLDRSTDFVVEVDFLDGQKESFHVWNNVEARWKDLTASAPRLHRQPPIASSRTTTDESTEESKTDQNSQETQENEDKLE